MKKLKLNIVSDLICPWCYIARTRIQKILDRLGLKAEIHWLPFELNPEMPASGMDRKEYRSKKFGSWVKSQALDQGVIDHGKGVGLDFHYEKIARTPNTLNGHRLLWLADKFGLSDTVSLRLFKAYFEEGKDIGDIEALKSLATEAGLKRESVDRLFSSDDGRSEVIEMTTAARSQGVRGVPFIILNDEHAFSGAQSDEVIEGLFKKALGTPIPSAEVSHG